MFRKNRRQSVIEIGNAHPPTKRFSLIRALSKLSRSKSLSKEAFAVGEEGEVKDTSGKGFFSRLFGKSSAPSTESAALLERKPSFWQKSKSFLKPKPSEVTTNDSLSTIDLPRIKKTQLPKLKIKGSGASMKVDLPSFVLGKPEVTVDTDALLQRMFELNEEPYLHLRQRYTFADYSSVGAYLSPVMTALTLSELTKKQEEDNEVAEEVTSEVVDEVAEEQVQVIELANYSEPLHTEPPMYDQHPSASQHVFYDNPQLDSPLLSVSGTLEDKEMSENCYGNSNESINEDCAQAKEEYGESDAETTDISSYDDSIEAKSIETSSDWSINKLNEEFGILDVKAPTVRSDGSLHFHLDDSQGGSGESIVFEDWRRNTEPTIAFQSTKANCQSVESIPRAVNSTLKARSLSSTAFTTASRPPRRKTLGARISEIVAIFERGVQDELNTNV